MNYWVSCLIYYPESACDGDGPYDDGDYTKPEARIFLKHQQ